MMRTKHGVSPWIDRFPSKRRLDLPRFKGTGSSVPIVVVGGGLAGCCTAYALAAALRVPRTRVERLIREETAVTPDTALRLARYFGSTPEFWLGIQARFDIETARQILDRDIAAIKPRKTA